MKSNDLKKPIFVLRLNGTHFKNELTCLGEQLVQILNCIEQETENLTWFAFDVFGSGKRSSEVLFPNPFTEIESADELKTKAKEIIQFHSGVFIGIEKDKDIQWDYHTLPETEEAEGLQHPEAEIEIRPFDTSYFEVYGMDRNIENKIKSCFM